MVPVWGPPKAQHTHTRAVTDTPKGCVPLCEQQLPVLNAFSIANYYETERAVQQGPNCWVICIKVIVPHSAARCESKLDLENRENDRVK